MDIEASPREWIIRKGSFYYRPDRAGYTGLKAAAGRYTQAEAEREAAVEPGHIVAVHQDRVPDDPVPASEAAATIAALRKRVEELEGALEPFAKAGEELPDDRVITEGHPEWQRCLRRFKITVSELTVRQFHRARAALSQATGGSDE